MDLDALLILQKSDLAAVLESKHKDSDLPIIFLDPGLAQDAMMSGLDTRRFDYRPLPIDRHFQARATAEAINRALAIDQSLTTTRNKLFGQGVFCGWDHVSLRFFFLRALIARQLGEVCDSIFPETAIGVFRPRSPQQFYFDSFITTDAFTSGRERWHIVGHYDKISDWVINATDLCFNTDWLAERIDAEEVRALTHLPTVYSHINFYTEQILKKYPCAIDLPSAFWDVKVTENRCPFIRLDRMPKNQIDHRSIVYREQARSILDSAILDIAPNPEARKLQVSWMADRCLVQMINYVRLSKVLKGTKPCFITTEHDTGTVGPLFSIAERLGSQIIVIPHSSYPTQPLPHAINVTAIERDGFLSPIRSVWGAKVKTRQVRLTPKILGPVRPKVRTVCLLLNTLYSRGISYIDLRGLMDFYRDLDELCTSSDVKLFVRMKPGGSCPAVIAGTLGIPISELNEIVKTDLGELAFGSDICINYGELSSGIIDFLEYNSYVLHTSEEMRPSDLLNTSNLSTMTSLLSMPRREIMGVIKKTLCESTYYAAQLQEQQREFLSRCIKSTDRIFED